MPSAPGSPCGHQVRRRGGGVRTVGNLPTDPFGRVDGQPVFELVTGRDADPPRGTHPGRSDGASAGWHALSGRWSTQARAKSRRSTGTPSLQVCEVARRGGAAGPGRNLASPGPIIAPSVNGTKVHRYLTASGGSTAGEPETARRRCFPRRGSRTPAVRPNTSSGPRSRRLPPGRRGGACRTRPTACPRWASDRCYRALDVEAGWTHSQPSGCAPGATRATRRGTTTSGPAAAYRAAAARPHPPAAAPARPASAASGSGRPRRDRGWPNPSRG